MTSAVFADTMPVIWQAGGESVSIVLLMLKVAMPSNETARKVGCEMKSLCVRCVILVVLGLLVLSGAAMADWFYNPVRPAAPGTIEYGLLAQGYTWVQTFDPIAVGIYVEDILPHRYNQPLGRGGIGYVTQVGIGDNNEWCALVDFGRSFSVGLDFHELSAVRLIAPVPEPSCVLVLLSGVGLVAMRIRRR